MGVPGGRRRRGVLGRSPQTDRGRGGAAGDTGTAKSDGPILIGKAVGRAAVAAVERVLADGRVYDENVIADGLCADVAPADALRALGAGFRDTIHNESRSVDAAAELVGLKVGVLVAQDASDVTNSVTMSPERFP